MNWLEINKLVKHFYVKKGGFLSKKYDVIHAVDGIKLTLEESKIMGLVGESGCGKTTVGKCILRFHEPTSGNIYFKGENIFQIPEKILRKNIQMIFQDPYSSLTPTKMVKSLISEPINIFNTIEGNVENEVEQLLNNVGLSKEYMYRYPHELSGGEKQRVSIARVLAVHPNIIVADEPIAALDVSVKAKILNLLKDLQERIGFSCLFISHELGVIKNICDRVSVMYLGKIVESGSAEEIFDAPKHPYTEALLSANPIPDPLAKRDRILLRGEVPTPINPPSGCRFHPRCLYAKSVCSIEEPELIDYHQNSVACHFPI
jgi:oligopeptide/dipeptide ABC transporter ATP-binding protein